MPDTNSKETNACRAHLGHTSQSVETRPVPRALMGQNAMQHRLRVMQAGIKVQQAVPSVRQGHSSRSRVIKHALLVLLGPIKRYLDKQAALSVQQELFSLALEALLVTTARPALISQHLGSRRA